MFPPILLHVNTRRPWLLPAANCPTTKNWWFIDLTQLIGKKIYSNLPQDKRLRIRWVGLGKTVLKNSQLLDGHGNDRDSYFVALWVCSFYLTSYVGFILCILSSKGYSCEWPCLSFRNGSCSRIAPFFSRCKGRTIRKLMGGRGRAKYKKIYSREGKWNEKINPKKAN